ncbi:unnamed protein product [Heterobilharzia americana]|nr:unnamed protein product [Heterobilharzia americana]
MTDTSITITNKSTTLSKISSITSATVCAIKSDIQDENYGDDNDSLNDISVESSVNYYYHTTFGFDELDGNIDDGTLASSVAVTMTTHQQTTTSLSQQQGVTTNQITKVITSESTANDGTNLPSDYLSSNLTDLQHGEEKEIYEGDEQFNFRSDDCDYAGEIVAAALKLWSQCYLAKKTVLAQLVPEAPLISGYLYRHLLIGLQFLRVLV